MGVDGVSVRTAFGIVVTNRLSLAYNGIKGAADMWESIGAVIGLLLALYGAADLIARLCWRLVFAGEAPPLTLSAAGEDAEYRIRRFAAWMRLRPAGGFTPTVVLPDENEQLQRLCEELGLQVCTVKDG